MNRILKLSFTVVTAVLLSSCGGKSTSETAAIETANEVVESTKIYAYMSSFTFDRDKKIVTNFIFSELNCDGNLCIDIKKSSEGKEMSFIALSESSRDYAENSKFDRQVKGELVIGKKKFPSIFSFRIEASSKVIGCYGMLTFKYADDEVNVYVKGKQ